MIAVYLYRNPRILLLAVSVIIASGVSAYFVIPQLEDPVLQRRVGVVTTAFPGATAESVESLITIPIEEELEILTGVKQIRSNTQAAISNVVIELEDEVSDVEEVWSEVREKINLFRQRLPEQALTPELDIVPLKAFAAILAIKIKPQESSARDEQVELARLSRVAQALRKELLSLPGTEVVTLFGESEEEIVVELTPEALAQLETSVGAVAQQVSAKLSQQPWGQLESSSGVLRLEQAGLTVPAQDLKSLLIRTGHQGETSQLSQIADVRLNLKDADYQALIDGEQSIVVAAMVTDTYSVSRWSKDFRETVNRYESEYGQIVSFDHLFSQDEHIHDRMFSLMQNLCFGVLAVTVVVFVMMGWRSTLLVACALPLTALFVVAAMRGLAIPIQQMSVTGLIVALGLLIDNAIVIVDELQADIRSGKSPVDAIRNTIHLYGIPLFGSTLTTALAFLPIATLPGPPGEFVGSIAIVVILAITGSLVISLTVIPSAYGIFSSRRGNRNTFYSGLRIPLMTRLYRSSLGIVMRFPLLGIALGVTLPCLGCFVSRMLPEQFFPPSDRRQIQIELEKPINAPLATTRDSVEQARMIVAQNGDVGSQFWFLGGSGPTFYYNVIPRRRGTPFYAQGYIELKGDRSAQDIVHDLQEALDEGVPDSRLIVRQLEQGPPIDAPIEVRLTGPHQSQLKRLGHEIRQVLVQSPDVIHSRSDFEESIPKIHFQIDESKTTAAGLTVEQLSGQVYTALNGAPAGEVMHAGEMIPVRVTSSLDQKHDLEHLLALPLQSVSSRPRPSQLAMVPPKPVWTVVPLGATLKTQLEADSGASVRINGSPVNEVRGYLRAGVLPSVALAEFKQRLAESEIVIPQGYEIQFGGEEEKRSDAVAKLISNGVVLFTLMLLTLVASFQSFRCAGIIATVGSLSIGLGPLALYLAGYPFGFTAIVGTMGLVGVAINDSIVVLAAIRSNPLARAGSIEEVVNVVLHCTRHIVSTTLTTIVGFLPLILGGGGFWPPLAICIAGGVAGATFMALYFVPALFLLLFPKRYENTSKTA